jgi:hypothetical protein
MARNQPQPEADREEVLECVQQVCLHCNKLMWNKYDNYRTVRTLSGVVRLRLKIRRCYNEKCEKFGSVYRPEAEGKWALPQYEFGLDVVALVGALRYGQHRSVPEIHQQLQQRDMCVGQRSVSHLIERYEELLALNLSNKQRLQEIGSEYQRVILAIDGMQPAVGHEVLWVIRECLSGEILLARTLLSARSEDLAVLLREVKEAIRVPIAGVVSDGQQSIRKAVEIALPQVPHGLCHFHYLREAAKPIYAADRHAKKELKKQVRGVRSIERSVANSDDPVSETVRGYCLAVRSALTDDGVPPLEASGLKLHSRLTLIKGSLERVAQKGD